MKKYCVVYLNAARLHCIYKCSAKNKREAKVSCCNAKGCRRKDIVNVYEEK